VEESRFGGFLPDCDQDVELLGCKNMACDTAVVTKTSLDIHRDAEFPWLIVIRSPAS
jgi:hypothetical protein